MSNKKILIIDEDFDFTAATGAILESRGYKVSSADNKNSGLEKIRQVMPDLIIMDLMMHKISDGVELAREIKNDEQYRKIPVLMLTAIGDKTGFNFSEAAGDNSWLPIDEYAQKPIKSEELIVRIEKLISK